MVTLRPSARSSVTPVNPTGMFASLLRNARSAELRRVQLAFTGFSISEHATWLAVLFFALERGGPREVGLIAFIQLVPSVVLTPFSSYAGDRFRPQRVLAAGYAIQSVSMAVVAFAMLSGNGILVYAASTIAATAVSFTRPVMGSLLPTLTHRPADLVAANVVTGVIQQIGRLGGPLMAGLLMAFHAPSSVFAACALITGAACLMVVLIPAVDEHLYDAPDVGDLTDRMFAGFATMRREARLRTLVGLMAAAGLVGGIADVLFVTFAAERLDGGGGQAGLLAAAFGVGGILGVVAVSRVVRGTQVEGIFVASALLVSLALASMALSDGLVTGLLLFALLGVGVSLVQFTAAVTIQRQAPTEVLARVFGIVEGAEAGAMAVAGLLVTVLVVWFSVNEAFVALAMVVFALIGLGIVTLRRHGDDTTPVDDEIIDRLVHDQVFAALPAPKMERLGRTAVRRRSPVGTAVVVQGDVGEHYFLIVDGTLSVVRDGKTVNSLGAGQSFGEIALLRDVPRTSTVAATSDVELLMIARDDFLEAVTGHPRSLATAHGIADGHVDLTHS